ncbi:MULTISPECIES: hypothetical protein [Protofrankia]|uniref:Uncharacterized protein n=1 Tax=Protofrankia coriariae TaxID=1562887 RepID=A0ABR5EZI6_9ACTN|nr:MULTISPECIES: hypothetical protein [Protofrankia]KLL09879.1 hypothetical protein FrCorBMG51_21860 [Protofrankia coriariae]ONH34203.1 hypothetical protein BL254_17580 [Protofrankia sp. BMG5.30]
MSRVEAVALANGARARRGNVALLVSPHREPLTGGGPDAVHVELVVIRSVTRDGRVRAYEEMWPGGRPVRVATIAWTIISLVDASALDPARAVAIARAHTYPGHRQVRPWASLAEARAALRPARTSAP